jgi:hypothetical protein
MKMPQAQSIDQRTPVNAWIARMGRLRFRYIDEAPVAR